MKRFYWENPLVFEAEVELTQIDGSTCNISPIIFHPDEGGQPPDRGTIGDANIIRIEPSDGDAVLTLDKPLQSGRYTAHVDISHRLAQSRRHTAQHIISGIAEKEFGLATTGVKISESCTIDFDKKIEWDGLARLEVASNTAIMKNIPVETEYGTLAQRGRFGDSLSEKDSTELRVVSIDGIDRSACCGTHARSTGMIGSVRIVGLEASRQRSRITFVAGEDAIGFGASESAVLRELRKTASCSNDELNDSFTKIALQNSTQMKEIANLWEKLIPIEIGNAQTIDSGFGMIYVLWTTAPPKLIGMISSMMSAGSGETALVLSSNPYQISISSPSGKAKEIWDIVSRLGNGKGGGSPNVVNGSLSGPVSYESLKQSLLA